jgi:hypothetical protein
VNRNYEFIVRGGNSTHLRLHRYGKVLIIILLAECILLSGNLGQAASPKDFSSTNSTIQAAFIATYNANQSGGNVSQLVIQLNLALALVQQAQSQNATNPTKAAADLQNATMVAERVIAASGSVAQMGRASRQSTELVSVEAAYLISVAAVLACVFGDRVYRRLWRFVFKDYVLETINE